MPRMKFILRGAGRVFLRGWHRILQRRFFRHPRRGYGYAHSCGGIWPCFLRGGMVVYAMVRGYMGIFFGFWLSTSAQPAPLLCFAQHKPQHTAQHFTNQVQHENKTKKAQTCALLNAAVLMLYLCCTFKIKKPILARVVLWVLT